MARRIAAATSMVKHLAEILIERVDRSGSRK
jgi:hypothetical protein